MQDHAKRKAMVAEIKGLTKDERFWQKEATRECLTSAQVVCGTLTGAAGFQMGPYAFGLTVIDEAAQVCL